MSADETQEDYRLGVLRAAGHEDAADLLAKLPVQAQAPAIASGGNVQGAAASMKLLPDERYEDQDGPRRRGQTLLDEMRRQGIAAAGSGEAA